MQIRDIKDRIKCYITQGEAAFELEDSAFLDETALKVLENCAGDGLLRVYESKHNGRIRLVYDTEDLRPLSVFLPGIPENALKLLGEDMRRILGEILDNGFLKGEGLLLETEYIFIDPVESKCHLICLPLVSEAYPRDICEPRKELTELLQYVAGTAAISLEEETGEGDLPQDILSERLYLEPVSGDAVLGVWVPVMGGILGRDPMRAQILMEVPTVSGVHCRIEKKNGVWVITDLGSTNGTKVNGTPLLKGQSIVLQHGDKVELATAEFETNITRG